MRGGSWCYGLHAMADAVDLGLCAYPTRDEVGAGATRILGDNDAHIFVHVIIVLKEPFSLRRGEEIA